MPRDEHGQPTAARLFAAQILPKVALQRPMPDEGVEIRELAPRLRRVVITRILHRFVISGPKGALTVDCPGLGGDSLGLLPPADITLCCLAVGNTQVYGPTLTPIDKCTPNGHEVAYGDISGIHEMTVASRNAERWEQLGLGAAHEIHHRSLITLQQAQRPCAFPTPLS